MSKYSDYRPNVSVGHQRYLTNGSDSIDGYLLCDGSVYLQNSYPNLFSVIGLIGSGYNTSTSFMVPTSIQLFPNIQSQTFIKY